MLKNIILIFLITSIITCGGVNGQLLEVAKAIGTGVSYVYKIVSGGKNYVDKIESNKKRASLYLSIKDTLNEINDNLKHLKDQTTKNDINPRMLKMQEAIAVIDNYYDDYMAYSSSSAHFSNNTIKTFSEDVLNHNVGIDNRMVTFDSNLIGNGADSLVRIMEKHIEILDPFCSSGRSRQQYFYDFFLKVMATHFKAYFTLKYAIKVAEQIQQIPMNSERDRIRTKTVERINATVLVFNEVLKRSSQDIWKCDTSKFEKNTNYVKLNNVFRWIFYSDKDFAERRSITCPSKCPSVNRSRELVANCHTKNECTFKQRICKNVAECTTQYGKESYSVCIKNNNAGRRYTKIVDQNDVSWWTQFSQQIGGMFGANVCDGDTFSLAQTYMQGGPYNPNMCVSCKCICDERGVSDRYFSLRPMTSNIKSNRVVTGVRLVKENNTLFIQIQQGKLIRGGFINEKTTDWKPLDDQEDDDNNEVDDNDNDEEKKGIENKIFANFAKELKRKTRSTQNDEKFRLEWFDRRGLYLDDIELPKDELVTGVKFAVDKRDDQYFMKLDVRSTKFNPQNGKLIPDTSYWYSSKAPEPKRSKLDLSNLDTPVSVSASVKNKPDNDAHQYTFITPTKLTSKDAGQNVLPFIDIQNVISTPPFPLSGVGLDIKKAGDSGGYLMLKIKTYNVLWL